MEDLEQLRYPLGRFREEPRPTPQQHAHWIGVIEALPGELRTEVQDLSASQLATPYRPGGWSVCQVVHHLADSHLNAYIRTKLALTEVTPDIKPYDEAAWAELPDARTISLESSLSLLTALHARWVASLSALDQESLLRTLAPPRRRPHDRESGHPGLCLALPPPPRPHQHPARAAGLVTNSDREGLLRHRRGMRAVRFAVRVVT